MRIVLLSDIHANATALYSVLSDVAAIGEFDSVAILGDLVNYGPRPNEVIEVVKSFIKPLVVNLWGNHEYSIFGGNLDRFATDRGRAVLKYTNGILTDASRNYLDLEMNHLGFQECELDGKSILFMHGTLEDPYWGKFGIDKMREEQYAKYDYVISGHSHVPHYVEQFYATADPIYRNKKRTIFVNPGSVGQPRNHNPYAQYGILDLKTGNYEHRSVWYDVEAEQKLYDESVDVFYKERLKLGI